MGMIMYAEDAAASLYDGGWRASDRDDLQREYGLSDSDTEILVAYLQQYEQHPQG